MLYCNSAANKHSEYACTVAVNVLDRRVKDRVSGVYCVIWIQVG